MTTRLITAYNTASDPTEVKLYKMYEASTAKIEVTLPTDVIGTDKRTVTTHMNNREYLAGSFSEHLVFDEFENLKVSGILPPPVAPSIATSGSGTLTGVMIPYITAIDRSDTNEVKFVESNPVQGASVEFASHGSRVWTLSSDITVRS
jgi:hypothetical protein